ncbi:MAG: GT4 family glycosyltransferase PelF [Magnetococcales bacterium]|nr:GT4 family glycosyltransferase PelF [Magnetococcales bacterium]
MNDPKKRADVCLILEGTYPYVAGGVSSWVRDLIFAQKTLTFHLVMILPPGADRTPRYDIPDNVIGKTEIVVGDLPKGNFFVKGGKKLLQGLESPLQRLTVGGGLTEIQELVEVLAPFKGKVGRELLLNSEEAWQMLQRMYYAAHSKSSFLDYFWTWRALLGGVYSILLAPTPKASVYHAISTGYAGLFLAKSRLTTGRPGLLTEHGIYTNERRIEITMADWLAEDKVINSLHIDKRQPDLRDIWVETFVTFSRACYACCEQIITLYEGNQEFQLEDGADPDKLRVIPNGIDYDHYAKVEREQNKHPPTIALIGRVVPIKDIKTYIRAVYHLHKTIPNLIAYVCGPTDEDPIYHGECLEMVSHLDLTKTLIFTGRVNLVEYLGQIDVMVLTSISEAQPLVILEAGAAGVPSVATDVGSCREMIEGNHQEDPPLGRAGEITPLSDPVGVADALAKMLNDPDYLKQCAETIKQRVRRYYHKSDLNRTYLDLYNQHVAMGDLLLPADNGVG